MKNLRTILAITLTTALLVACEDRDEMENPMYKKGYEAGRHDGWVETCDRIKTFSDDLERRLVDERIC